MKDLMKIISPAIGIILIFFIFKGIIDRDIKNSNIRKQEIIFQKIEYVGENEFKPYEFKVEYINNSWNKFKGLAYDVRTKIVYIYDRVFTNYYSENGKICKYNPETDTIYEVEDK